MCSGVHRYASLAYCLQCGHQLNLDLVPGDGAPYPKHQNTGLEASLSRMQQEYNIRGNEEERDW